ncbi:NUDIX hydrolase [Asticcacaulis sp. YBE204]|uniref:NUDIX hydrolase n=1 Tax=Asticcacaulis sp. YBE204 TaxID=1282363 RepID=UPI0003C3FBFE|nr:NUDIX hydrolase [Asticcacaulis sp. YBE204]ESQ78749.1 hypothetical protein AEYBE204_12245 [Asticcacaulis sp. YBE204]
MAEKVEQITPPANQYAALPYRLTADGNLEFLLITSRGSGQWIIPKGKPIAGMTSAETAAREAFEEAGVQGDIGDAPIGRFAYVKDQGQITERFVPGVEVYPLKVTGTLTLWPEFGQRQILWCDTLTALGKIDLEALRTIVRQFAATHQPSDKAEP